MTLERIEHPGGAILHDPRLSGGDPARLFDLDYWRQRRAIVEARGGRGSTSFIDAGERQYVLRRYLRGGLVARISTERYLWLGEARTRAFHELRLLATLRDRGLPVPAPVAARYRRHGLSYSAELVTERLPDSRSLTELWLVGEATSAHWLAVGRCIRRFHDAGVQHADLNAHNVVLDARGRAWLLDFDRGRLRRPGPWHRRSLERLGRSLAKVSRGTPQAAEAQSRFAELLAAHDHAGPEPPRAG